MNSTPPSDSEQRVPGAGPTRPNFATLFCELQGCPVEEYEERAFRACLYFHARLVAPIIRRLWPAYFERDLALIRYLGSAPGRRHAMNELAAFMEANETRGGFLRKGLRIRVSARKASDLLGRLFGRRPDTRSGPPASGDTTAIR